MSAAAASGGGGGRGGGGGGASSSRYDYLVKFIVIGDSGAGKTCLLRRFTTGRFAEGAPHTIGVEFGATLLEVGTRRVKVQIWDTAGQENFRSITRSYYRGTAGALLVYDVSSRDSFAHCATWLNDLRSLSWQPAVLLCANKADLVDSRAVSFEEASAFAKENDLQFLETSARTGAGVQEAFVMLVRRILTNIEAGLLDPCAEGSGIQLGSARRGFGASAASVRRLDMFSSLDRDADGGARLNRPCEC